MRWLSEYNTGIEVIDDQHQRILEYINELEEVRKTHDRAQVKDVLLNLIDYTQSHFAFEESLQEEANYKYRVPHKRVHDLFIKKLSTIVNVLKWVMMLRKNFMKCYQNG